MAGKTKPRVLFYRRLLSPNSGTNGGNLKVRDAFNYFDSSERWRAEVCFSHDTKWYPGSPNLWSDLKDRGLPSLNPRPGDLLFFSGRDWLALPEKLRLHPPVPVLNIAQPRHVREGDGRREFLAHPAIRIAKSEHGADILMRYGVNGPLHIIPDAIDLGALPRVPKKKDIDILVLGLKQPDFGKKVYDKLVNWNEIEGLGLNIHLQLPPKLPTREAFLQLLARAKIVACIPLEAARGGEGFYLPALEAMALETLVVCPHSIGNVGHCVDGVNCIVPKFSPIFVARAIRQMQMYSVGQKKAFRAAGLSTAGAHDASVEKRALLDLADGAYAAWSAYDFSLPLPSPNRTDGRRSWWPFPSREK